MKNLITTVLCFLIFQLAYNQCAPNGSESGDVTLVPLTSNQNTGGTEGVGSGSARYYPGFYPNVSYTVSLNNAPGNLSCRNARFVNASNVQLGSWFNIATANTQVAPAGTAKLLVQTSRSSNWNGTSAILTYRANTTVTTPATMTGTVTNEVCPADNNGSITGINISNALSNVRYIKLTQRRTSDNHINLAELRAFQIFGGSNVALGATVTSNVASLAGWGYDGLTDGATGSAGTDQAHTGSADFGNYIQVDLGSGQDLDYIEIVNRNGCCYTRADNLLLELFNASGNLLYSNVISLPNSSLGTYTQNVLDMSWSDGATTLNRTGLNAGTYTLNYADVSGNTTSQAFAVGTSKTVSTPGSISGGGVTICAGSSTSLSVSGGSLGTGAVWRWYSGSCGGTLVGTGASISVSPSSATNYYVRAEGDCNTTACSAVATVSVDANPIVSNTTSTDSLCENGTRTLVGSWSGTGGAGTGVWSIDFGGGTIVGTTYTPDDVASNTLVQIRYTVTNGVCVASVARTFYLIADPILQNNTSTDSICETDTKNLIYWQAGPAATINWSVVSGPGFTSGNTYFPDNIFSNTSVTVRVTATTTAGNCPSFRDVTFMVYDRVFAFNTTSTADICENGTKTLVGSYAGGGGVGIEEWSIVSGGGSILGTTYTPDNVTSNTSVTVRYTVTNGPCSDSQDRTFNVIATPSASAGPAQQGCVNATFTLAAINPTAGTGTGAWTWSPSAPTYVSGSATDFNAQVSFATGGVYTGTWTVTNAPCADATSTVDITVSSAATNVVLASGTVNAVAVCEESPWTYYADPATPNDYVFAIAKNGNGFTASVAITDEPGTAPIESLGGQPNVRGTWLISRYWNVTTDIPVVNPVSIRFFIDSTEIVDALADATAFAAANPWPSIPVAVTPLTWFKTNGSAFNPVGGLVNGNFSFAPTYLTSSSDGRINSVKYYQFDNITSFSGGSGGFSVNDNGSPLPVELLEFDAKVVNNEYVQVDWSTATEINNDGFEVLRSTDGVNFETIAWIAGNGNSNKINRYSYNDYEVSSGITYYYQLKQVDFNDESELFHIVSAKLTANSNIEFGNLVPNPTKELTEVSIDVFSLSNEVINMVIYNHVGVKVLELKNTLVEGNNSVILNIGNLPSGSYFINFEGSFGRETKKLIVIN